MTATQQATASKFALSTLYEAARMYYVEESNQVQIADRLKVSRPTVSRLLAEARRIGIVRIEVTNPLQDETDELSARLAETLGLEKVYLAAADHSRSLPTGLTQQVSTAIADMALTPGQVLLVSSGRTTYEVSHGPLPELPGVVVVPTVGGQTEPEAWYQTNEIARILAEKTGARSEFLFAQALPSDQMYDSLQRDPSFQRVQRLWNRADGALLGIGAPPTTRSSISRFIPTDDDALLRAVGDICLNFFDAAGTDVQFAGSERMINTPLEVLRAIRHTVAVATGTEKAISILAGARGGYFRSLVTDTTTARAVIELATKTG